MCSGCGGWPTTIGCAPKTPGPGPGPYGWECPQSQKADSFRPWGHPSPGNGWPAGQEDGHQAWHYFVDACNMYQTQNSSTDGLGCDRTGHGTGYANQYEPAVSDMLSNVSTCPTEQLLFFHHLSWMHPMELSNGTTVPLIDYIAATRCALE